MTLGEILTDDTMGGNDKDPTSSLFMGLTKRRNKYGGYVASVGHLSVGLTEGTHRVTFKSLYFGSLI